MLNAFRHHRGRHGVSSGWRWSVMALCSTPFGITEVGTSLPGGPTGPGVPCSTPFGITEVGTLLAQTRRLLSISAQRLSASKRSALILATPTSRQRTSAQRLSASQRSAPGETGGTAISGTCSTPFGITEVGTHSFPSSPASRGVLNAFRHHRGRHTVYRKRIPLRVCAQRLSASQRSARYPRSTSPRHQAACSTPFGITEVGTCSPSSAVAGTITCSTPFGITEVGTSRKRTAHRNDHGAQRLSASQRSAH